MDINNTITDADYADDEVLLANTPVQAEFLLQSLKQTARRIGNYRNANKTEFMVLRKMVPYFH